MPVIRKSDLKPLSGSSYPPPHNEGMGNYEAWPFSDAGGLTQFGAYLETLHAGARSSLRHWHENEDEFIYLLSGELVVIDNDGEHVMRPGEAATFKAGDPNAHCLTNRTQEPATYLVVGTRAQADRCHYADVDMVYVRDQDGRRFEKRDGTLIAKR